MAPWNRRFLLETIIFRFYVKLGEVNPWLRKCSRCTSGISWTHSPQPAFKCGFLSVVMDALVNEEPWGTVSWPLMLRLPHHALYWYQMSLWFSPLLWKEQWNWGNLCKWKFNSEITHKTWRCHMQLNLTTHVGTFRFIYWNIVQMSASFFYSESILQSQQWTMTLLFMEEILHQLVVSQYLPSFTSFSSSQVVKDFVH